jgi:D-amino-acid oxidase
LRVDVTVVGAGVIGLSCAVRLAESGFAVRVMSRAPPVETTSGIAAAVWFPFLAEPRDRVLAWAAQTRRELERLAVEEPESGVVVRELLEVVPVGSGEGPPWWAAGLSGCRPAAAAELPSGHRTGHVARVPLAETPLYLPWLATRLAAAGGQIEIRPEGVASLDEAARGAALVVHCSGLAARELAGDPTVFPVRGQVALLGSTAVERVVVDDCDPSAPTYVIPRRDGVVVGGTAEVGAWETTPDPAVTAAIVRRATALVPALRGAPVLAERVGLRPARPAVRLEAGATAGGAPVIHCYGHGGSGLTLSWGCADEVLGLARGLA